MPKPHDVGGRTDAGLIDRSDHHLEDWEILADAIAQALAARKIWNTDFHRRVREQMPGEMYGELSYYERWIYAIEEGMIELGVLERDEIDRKTTDLEIGWGGS